MRPETKLWQEFPAGCLILSGMDGAEEERSVVGASMLGPVEGPGVGSLTCTAML